MADELDLDEYEAFLEDLRLAERHAQRALDRLYANEGVNRSTAYKIRLGNAQSVLMSLYVREVNAKTNKHTGGKHEWEELTPSKVQCVYCGQKAPRQRSGRTSDPAFGLRLFVLGQWRCPG